MSTHRLCTTPRKIRLTIAVFLTHFGHVGLPTVTRDDRVDDEFHKIVDRAQSVQGTFNKPRSILDLYTPRFVKGVGAQKVGMCPVW